MGLTINGNTEFWQIGTLNISDEINSRNTASFGVVTASALSVGQRVIITDGAATIFAGTIDSYSQSWLRGADTGNRKRYDVQCIDYNQLLDKGTLLATTYINATISDILSDVSGERTIGTVLAAEGLTLGTIAGGSVVIKQAVFNYISVTDALNYIKDVTGLNWNVDYNGALQLFYRSDYTGDIQSTRILDIRKSVTRQEYRNKQLVRGGRGRTGTLTAQKPTPKPDGVSREFFFRYPLAEQPLLYLNAAQVSPSDIGINGLDKNKKWYWSYGSDKVTQDDAETVLPDTTVLTGDFIGLRRVLGQAENPVGIAARQAIESGTSGIYEQVVERKELDTNDSVLDYANGLLSKYADIPERVFISGLDYVPSGQIVPFVEAKVDINGSYLIESVDISDAEDGSFRYVYSLASGEALGGWVEFFRKLVNTGQDFTIQNDEVLIFIISNSETITLEETGLTATVTKYLTPDDVLYDIDGRDDYFGTGCVEVIL